MASENALKTFEFFKEQCIWLQEVHTTYQLFDPTRKTGKEINAESIYQNSAAHTFVIIFRSMQTYIRLQIAKLLDPAKTGKDENLSILNIDGILELEGKMTDEIRNLSVRIRSLGEPIRKSRHKVIAHADKKAIMEDLVLGEISEAEWDELIESIYNYVILVGKALGIVVPDYYSLGSGPGDPSDLINYIRAGLAFYGKNGARRFYPSEDFYQWAEQKNLGESLLSEWIKVSK